jgi:hypothetical protein
MFFMYRFILLFCFLLIITGLSAQEHTASAGSNFWHILNSKKAVKLGLPNLSEDGNIRSSRWSYNGQTVSYALDLYQSSDSVLRGFLTIYTEENVDLSKETPTNRVYQSRINLAPEQVDKLNYCMQTSGIMKLPTDSLIKGWVQGFDGVTYCLEYKGDKLHSFKSFWSPQAQENILEGELVQSFAEYVAIVIDLNTIQKEFVKKIPFESYSTGGPSIAIRILTKAQQRNYKKDRDRYRKQQAGKF